MARRPRRKEAVATALQGGRPQRDVVRLLRRGAVALGRGAIDGLLLGPLRRLIWRWFHSRSARRGCVAARKARRDWRDDPEPAGDPLLRRAVARVGGAIQAMLAPGRRVLDIVCNLLQRVLGVGRYFLQLGLFPGFHRRLPRPRQPCPRQRQRPETQPPPQRQQRRTWLFYPRPVKPKSTSPPPPPSPPPITMDGIVVPKRVVRQYATYCSLASGCPERRTVCHFCVFEIQKSRQFTAPTGSMYIHCRNLHNEDGPGVCCDEAGCSVRVRAGLDQARHAYFCLRLLPGWWEEYL